MLIIICGKRLAKPVDIEEMNLLKSEIFGHGSGVFLRAVSRRKGRFELAHKGPCFLMKSAI